MPRKRKEPNRYWSKEDKLRIVKNAKQYWLFEKYLL